MCGLSLTGSACGQGRAAVPPAESYDVVFFGPRGAVFLRILVEGGDKGVTAIRRAYCGAVFRSLDKDASRQLEPAEAAEVPLEAGGGAQRIGDGWTRLDSAPQDGTLSEDELFTYLDERIGPRFRIEGKPPRLQQSVNLHPRLDTNGDGYVSRAEIEAGLSTLHSFDFDDDQSLSVAELQPFPTAILQAQRQQEASAPNVLPVMELQTQEQRAQVAERLMSMYGDAPVGEAGRSPTLPLEKLALAARAETEVDAHRDGRLAPAELAALLEQPRPAVVASVQLPRNRVTLPERPAPGPQLEVATPKDALGRRVALVLGGMELELRAKYNAYEAQDLASFYLQNFNMADGDKNKYLSEQEFATLNVPNAVFASVDANGDGMVVRDELRAHMDLYSRLTQAALVLTVSDDATTLFELLDPDKDNRLTPREFVEGFAQTRRFDRNRDGRLAAGEMVSKYGFEFAFATPEFFRNVSNQAMAAQARMPRIRPQTSGPTWFRKMDRNQDGDLMWREFLGSREDFERIDADRNGMIDLNEAVGAAIVETKTE
jgi:Ca2+-binding EF-hand superfamily protein